MKVWRIFTRLDLQRAQANRGDTWSINNKFNIECDE